jgi:thioredoxin 1
MNKYTKSLFALAAALTFSALTATAAEPVPFQPKEFAKAKSEGKTILVDFHADWCPVCRKQSTVLPQVLKTDTYQNVVAFTADFDSEKKLKKQLKVNQQSTLVVFKGEKEIARQSGITSTEDIEKLLNKGL